MIKSQSRICFWTFFETQDNFWNNDFLYARIG